MKTRLMAVLLAIAVLTTLSACKSTDIPSGSLDGGNRTSSGASAKESPTQDNETLGQFQATATLDETILVDENGVKITATELTYTSYTADLAITIENNSGKDLSFISGSLGYSCNSINGYMVDDGYLNCDVANGKKANDVIQFSYDALMAYGINEIADMEIGFDMVDADYNSIYTGPRALKTSAANLHDDSADSYQQTITSPAAMNTYGYEMLYFGQDAAYDQDGVKLLSSGLLRNRDGETVLLLELENTSDSLVYVSASDIRINGLVVSSSVWSSDTINPGKRRIAEVELSSAFDGGFWSAYGIDEVGSVSVSLGQYDEGSTPIGLKTPVEITVPGVFASFDDAGTEVYNNNGLRVVFKTLLEDDSDLNGDLYVLLLAENNSGKTLTIGDVYDSLSVNGFMTDYSLYSQELENGESAALAVQLWESSLEDNKIASAADIQEVEMKLEIKEEYTTIDEPLITLSPNT